LIQSATQKQTMNTSKKQITQEGTNKAQPYCTQPQKLQQT
jgi:hypothetical protein